MYKTKYSIFKLVTISCFILWLSGCTTYGVVLNESKNDMSTANSYSISSYIENDQNSGDEISIMLTFSGGGTRAAALAYSVLKTLRDTRVNIDGRSVRLLDEVDLISAVSGGSFTAAYYGLYGERIFDDFDEVFLRRDVESKLIKGLYNPFRWFGSKGRTDYAITYLDEIMFHGATFADIPLKDRPLILINASDLAEGVRFSFLQEYFNLLCSDLSSFPISRAVVASSAVPVLFNPVVLRNHSDCLNEKPDWLTAAQTRLTDDSEMSLAADGLETYFDKEKREYIHLVDGGITDNLGLRAIYEIIEIGGGAKAFLSRYNLQPSRHVLYIVVDASADLEPLMDKSHKEPDLEETINTMTDTQVHRYNAATLELLKQSQTRWAQELSTEETTVVPHFIQLGFRDLDHEKQQYFNEIPTSLALEDEQVDRLIKVGAELLHANPTFQQLMVDLSKEAPSSSSQMK